MADTKIEWATKTWNPVTGCTKISPGCEHCYAERMSKRLAGRCGYSKDEPFKVTLHEDRLHEPMKWRKPARIFVCSMGDLFHNDVPFDAIKIIMTIIMSTPQHTYLLLTKRPIRMKKFFVLYRWAANLPNVWLGVTAENQEQADKRIPILLQIPAAVRFVSVEPMLGAINLDGYAQIEYESYIKNGTYSGQDTDHGGYVARVLGNNSGGSSTNTVGSSVANTIPASSSVVNSGSNITIGSMNIQVPAGTKDPESYARSVMQQMNEQMGINNARQTRYFGGITG